MTCIRFTLPIEIAIFVFLFYPLPFLKTIALLNEFIIYKTTFVRDHIAPVTSENISQVSDTLSFWSEEFAWKKKTALLNTYDIVIELLSIIFHDRFIVSWVFLSIVFVIDSDKKYFCLVIKLMNWIASFLLSKFLLSK